MRADALAPGDEVICSAMDEECWGAVGTFADLGQGADGVDLGRGGLGKGVVGVGGSRGGGLEEIELALAGEAVEEYGEGLGVPVHVEDDAGARIRG